MVQFCIYFYCFINGRILAVTYNAEPVRVCITGAAGQIGYSLVYMVGSGAVFGTNTPVVLHLLDIAPMMGVLNGVCMEIADCALPCVRDNIGIEKALESQVFRNRAIRRTFQESQWYFRGTMVVGFESR
ncbi:Malate dehydrogenase, cytoplasmic, partial [Armadillidium vulgare]